MRQLGRAMRVPLNLEMAATPAMTAQAQRFKAAGSPAWFRRTARRSRRKAVSMLPAMWPGFKSVIRKASNREDQGSARSSIRKSNRSTPRTECGARIVELHTGAYANRMSPGGRKKELARHGRAAARAHELNMQVNAGHGLHYSNCSRVH